MNKLVSAYAKYIGESGEENFAEYSSRFAKLVP